jgi:hypothetical protein
MRDEKNFLGASTLATSRRSFIAGWKLCAGVALGLGLGLAARSASAQQNPGQQGQNNNPQNPGQRGQNRGR